MDRNVLILIVLGVVNIPLYLLLGQAMFDSWAGFGECLKYWLQPDSWSFIKGEWSEDQWSEFKLMIFVVLCFGMVIGEFSLIRKYVLKDSASPAAVVQDSSGAMLQPEPQ